MINAIISNNISTHTGNFGINIAFDESVTVFTISDITFAAVSGNGITGITHTLSGSGASYIVNVSVPANTQGSFSVDISGMVNVSGTAQNVVATAKTFRYDTVAGVGTTLSPLQYNTKGDQIILPVVFADDVIWFDKSDLSVKKKAGSDSFLLDLYVRGQDRKFDIVILPEQGTWGAVGVDIIGDVIKETNLTRKSVDVDELLVSYNNVTPVIADVETPFKSTDGWWNIALEMESPIVDFGIHSIITGIEHKQDFIYRGLRLDVKPEDMPPVFSDVYPFAEVQRKHCVGDWEYVDLMSTEQARYFWVKLNPKSSENKTPEILLKDQNGLSPVSVAI